MLTLTESVRMVLVPDMYSHSYANTGTYVNVRIMHIVDFILHGVGITICSHEELTLYLHISALKAIVFFVKMIYMYVHNRRIVPRWAVKKRVETVPHGVECYPP